MIELVAPAKLTLRLHITGVRSDGMHLIDAEMVSLDLADRLLVDPDGQGVVVDGHDVGPTADNLVQRALELVGRQAHVRVDKAIPPGAGLGGGSADAAAILAWAGFDDVEAAARLGADVAFCLRGGRARVTGIGDVLETLLPVEQVFTLLTPPFGCSTPAVYRRWDELGGPTGEHGNDLEPAAVSVAPELVRYRDELGEATGRRPRLAGSGSTWFVDGAHPGPGRVVVTTTGPRDGS
ncbi:MAG: 4-(cytidine 5'-diphospho)-2-C-methyl-D-erythritol kinase [Acidimicrobiia bacterium]|nr:4-(cytidine 5'-diphospho)-2-C-methyl-D-erythritol kinase [Acidimicrobiia bacterium]